ncbi:L-amino acid N-acyltransferase YncA [Mesorhizobium albiziae]|uniref:L-amino acid N-acyltransferase YncA n=1 Tax=Neomesorhizobium albiziae TaxID=335020 RepID=A0A1I4FK80_9HYPH|nr:GNAT family N-acetyltransferase [Mesorhizobium albiziae]GLS32593.1 hypothetical protein GCM10007937_43030 [Mesorhizobium albiziae]SFL17720.1 L-amino acid N-acyltransferase YncA [Mesorhizobium albiziae]
MQRLENHKMQTTLRPLTRDDLPEFRAWFEHAELSRRLSFPTDEFYMTAGDAARCWMVLDAGQVAAEVQVDREDAERGYIDLALRPDLRGQGIGAAVLSAFLSGPGRAYSILEGRIEPDNAAVSHAASAVGSLVARAGCGGLHSSDLQFVANLLILR